MRQHFSPLMRLCLWVFFSSMLLAIFLFVTGRAGYNTCAIISQIASFIFSALVIIDVLRSSLKPGNKVVWVLAVLLFQVFTGLAYYLTNREQPHNKTLA